MKKIICLLLVMLCLTACAAKSTDPEMDEYFANWIKDYEFADNTAATLVNNKKGKYTIMMVANGDLALISMKKGDYTIDRYLCGNTEYFFVNTETVTNKYYKVNVESSALANPKDIYNEMVFEKDSVTDVVYVGEDNVDNIAVDHVECKIDKNLLELYFNHTTGELCKLEYVGGSSLVFTNYDLQLPEAFNKAKQVDIDTINTYISEFQD